MRSAETATHAVRGIVKSFGVTWLTIARPGKVPGDVTFVLAPSTLREGTIEVGGMVSVRYRAEGPTLVATAVVVRQVPLSRPASRRDPLWSRAASRTTGVDSREPV